MLTLEFRDPNVQTPQAQDPFPIAPEEKLAIAEAQKRIGGHFVNYSMWAGGAAVAYTFLSGFRYLWQKDQASFQGTFRQRLVIMAPVMTMYAAGSGLIPVPFRRTIESALGRPAITLMDMDKVRKKQAEEVKALREAKEKAKAEAFADAQIAKQ
ncbi:hypothetical protein DUNSADRAFT_6325 [Dunaliella salina]|uniref:HIG1 domain-containing protein n=1 Tax=Dunaliella salina TaxID=3046 RepID=A0ABQ7GNL6_DUNSA|nr:hypothetical protein DUNSADRAFT_6325 [Dunaliella salina]|eukprot:KAF5836173.1 hypothetical protein DUNSADRAFT_6325 [Dunaliella salina]